MQCERFPLISEREHGPDVSWVISVSGMSVSPVSEPEITFLINLFCPIFLEPETTNNAYSDQMLPYCGKHAKKPCASST